MHLKTGGKDNPSTQPDRSRLVIINHINHDILSLPQVTTWYRFLFPPAGRGGWGEAFHFVVPLSTK